MNLEGIKQHLNDGKDIHRRSPRCMDSLMQRTHVLCRLVVYWLHFQSKKKRKFYKQARLYKQFKSFGYRADFNDSFALSLYYFTGDRTRSIKDQTRISKDIEKWHTCSLCYMSTWCYSYINLQKEKVISKDRSIKHNRNFAFCGYKVLIGTFSRGSSYTLT